MFTTIISFHPHNNPERQVQWPHHPPFRGKGSGHCSSWDTRPVSRAGMKPAVPGYHPGCMGCWPWRPLCFGCFVRPHCPLHFWSPSIICHTISFSPLSSFPPSDMSQAWEWGLENDHISLQITGTRLKTKWQDMYPCDNSAVPNPADHNYGSLKEAELLGLHPGEPHPTSLAQSKCVGGSIHPFPGITF